MNELKEAFQMYDQNGDGTVTLEEIAGVMHKLGQNPSIPELRAMIREVDADRDGRITFQEFCYLMANKFAQPQQFSEAGFVLQVLHSLTRGDADVHHCYYQLSARRLRCSTRIRVARSQPSLKSVSLYFPSSLI